MADQTVQISNLPDSGSPERVAFDLYRYLVGFVPKSGTNDERLAKHMALFRACHSAAHGGKPDLTGIT